ncbi:hypothetical protein FOCC_FOCC017210 [Frankliniella occidentalis]|nr:hypothetical protein FOCC_FOCC017210 [Frankliniella occidentalis]
MRALQLAVDRLSYIRPTKALILTDSKSAVVALDRREISPYDQRALIHLRTSLQACTEASDVWLTWVPAHKGISPNELADQAAKQACRLGTPHRVPLRLQGGVVPVQSEAKFLGLLMDSKLTWSSHLQALRTKCKLRLNFIRSLSGHWWGCQPMTLHRAYTSLVRSLLDYGKEVYDPKAKCRWNPLQSIQYMAARIITGAMTSTP